MSTPIEFIPTKKTVTRNSKVNLKLRDAWLRTFEDLKNQIKTWVYHGPHHNWSLEEIATKNVEEAPLGLYIVAIYEIQTPEGIVRLEPIARNYPGAGIVELYAWPTLARVRLIQNPDSSGWRVLTDSGIFLRQEWSQQNFVNLVKDLLAAE